MTAWMRTCPLCGSKAHLVGFSPLSGRTMYYAACGNRGCRLSEPADVSHMQPTGNKAVEAWNIREEPWMIDELVLEGGRIIAVWHNGVRYVREGA